MEAVNLFNAAVAGLVIGWWMRDIGHALRALLERAAPTPRPAGVDDDAAEPVAGAPAAGEPGAAPSPQPADGHDNRDHGCDGTKNLKEAHGESVAQKQEAGK